VKTTRFLLQLIAIALVLGFAGCTGSQGSAPASQSDDGGSEVTANEGQRSKPRMRWWRDEAIVAELQLDDSQVQAIQDLMAESSRISSELRDKERQFGLRYLRALSQDPYDPVLVERMSNQLTQVLEDEHRQRIDNVRALRDLLSEQQWTTLWNRVPRALQVGRFRALRGPKITVTDNFSASEDAPVFPTPVP